LTSAGLEIRDPKRRVKLVPYQTIHSVNLQSLGPMLGVEQYRCTIRSWEHRTLVIQNAHFVGIGRVKPRNDSYRQLVRGLHRVLGRRGVPVRFSRGSAGLVCVGWFLVLAAMLIFATALVVAGLQGIWLGGGILPAIPYGLLLIHNSRRETYAPDDLPAELLPELVSADLPSRRDRQVPRRVAAGC
jgi:hypothetical protein